jgi:hypothetical protein
LDVSSRVSIPEGVLVVACGSIVSCVLGADAVTLDGDFTKRERERQTDERGRINYVHQALESWKVSIRGNPYGYKLTWEDVKHFLYVH